VINNEYFDFECLDHIDSKRVMMVDSLEIDLNDGFSIGEESVIVRFFDTFVRIEMEGFNITFKERNIFNRLDSLIYLMLIKTFSKEISIKRSVSLVFHQLT
jgi:hypothetical protein